MLWMRIFDVFTQNDTIIKRHANKCFPHEQHEQITPANTISLVIRRNTSFSPSPGHPPTYKMWKNMQFFPPTTHKLTLVVVAMSPAPTPCLAWPLSRMISTEVVAALIVWNSAPVVLYNQPRNARNRKTTRLEHTHVPSTVVWTDQPFTGTVEKVCLFFVAKMFFNLLVIC